MNTVPPTQFDALTVDWQSDLDKSILDEGLAKLGLPVDPSADRPSCRVLDFRGFSDLDSALASYHGGVIPTLVVVSDSDQLACVFSDLKPADDVCTVEQAPAEAGYRLGRLFMAAMERGATFDALTGLANRERLLTTLRQELEQAGPDSPVSVVFVDIDRFRRLNDEYGRQFGDALVREVAEILQRGAQGSDIVARSGGEEFAIVVRAGAAQAMALAEYLREELATHDFGGKNQSLSLTASFGVATADEPCETDEMLRRADEALYAAKAQGRDRVVSAEDLAMQSGEDVEIRDFENRVRVLTERLTQMLTRRGRKLANRFRQEADTDGLTGLFVRRYFDKRLPREMENARRSSRPLSLIFLDIDHFGSVNKTHGFPTGDRALRYVADTLRRTVRTVDWIARYGGEELCVVMPDTTLRDAAKIAERIRVNISSDTVLTYCGADLALTASLGVGELAPEDISPEDFAQRTGDKTRQAKQSGRNRVCY